MLMNDFSDYSSEGRIFANMENKVITIRLVSENKKQFLDLLLLGDEQESMIDRYLEQGELFALYDGDLKSVCVVISIDDLACELKNIATYEKYQEQGYGNALINYLFDYYKDKYQTMLVGTGDVSSALSFYKRCGFELSHCIKNFFTDNYDHPMFENGIQLVDMVYLKKNLSANKEFSIRQATIFDIPEMTELYKNTTE
jgi:ribosomal protein S18 acetylase RimI-like enzyme